MLKRTLMALAAAGLMGVGVTSATAQEYVAKIGHFDPPTTARHLTLLDVAAAVSEQSNGAVELQIFPSSQLGNPRETIEGIQLGTIEGGAVPAAFLTGFNPAVAIFDIPYVMPNDRAVAQQLRQSSFGEAVLDTFADKGFIALDIWANGRKAFYLEQGYHQPRQL